MLLSNDIMILRDKGEHGHYKIMDLVQVSHVTRYPCISSVNRSLLPNEINLIACKTKTENFVYIIHQSRDKSPV